MKGWWAGIMCLTAGGTLAAQPPAPARPHRVDIPSLIQVRPLAPLSMRAVPGLRCFTSEHQGTFNGRRLSYRAELAETMIESPAGTPAASMFSTSYIASPAPGGHSRPVIFLFNGGPGGSSAFLHFTVGPQRLSSLQAADFASTTNRLVDNPHSILDVADLVFVDPVDTGFGRSRPEATDRFRSVDGDSEAMSQFVVSWLRTHDRIDSPTYILGESYGSMRAVAMARDLARSEPRVTVEGIILVGQAINFGQWGRIADPARSAARLPYMASVAWHHGKIDRGGQTWEQAVERARQFARNEYLPALSLGYRLDQATFDRIASRLPGLIGIPEDYFRSNDTIIVRNFNSELLRDRGLVLDRNDGTQTRPAPAPGTPAPNPYARETYLAFSSNMERYAAETMGGRELGIYTVLAQPRTEAARWEFITAGAPNLGVTLGNLLREHGSMRLLVLQGRYDVLTDLGATEHTMSQIDLPLDRYQLAYYDGGHMLTAGADALGPLRAFVTRQPQQER